MRESRDNQIRRTARLLEIVQQIAGAPKYWTRKGLANHHEISERMIQKDLELVRYKLGLELENEGDGYYFRRMPHMPVTTYSFSEAVALLSAARAAQALPGINSVELAAAITRLESIFPQEFRPLLRDSLDRLPRSAERSHRQEMLTLLHRAYYERKQVCIAYQANQAAAPKERLVEPYALQPYGRSWYLIAYDHRRQAVLQFKLDRIVKAEITENLYKLPEDFDLDEYQGDAWGVMRGEAQPAETVVLRFNAETGRRVVEESWHKSQQVTQRSDGAFEVRFFVGVTPEMVSWLLYYGADVVVVEPQWLRDQVVQAHQKAVSQNGN